MSYPNKYDPHQCSNSLKNAIPNNQMGISKKELNSQCDTFHSQTYGGLPAPIPYQNQPTNVVFPPMDFSVPPPNFQPQNLNVHFNQFVRTLPLLPPAVQSSHHNNSTENINQNFPCVRSNNSKRNINENSQRRNINENSQRSNISSSARRNNVSSSSNRSERFRRDQFSSRSDVRHSNYKRNDEQKRDRDRHSSRSSSLHSNRSRSRRDYTHSRSSTQSRSSRSSRPPDPKRSSRPRTTPPIRTRKDDRESKAEPEQNQNAGGKTERAIILEKWRSNFCETSEDIARKLEEMTENTEKECWIRSSPADLFYKRTSLNESEGTSRSESLCTLFDSELLERGQRARIIKPAVDQQPKKRKHRVCRHKSK